MKTVLKRLGLPLAMAVFVVASAHAEVKTRTISYNDGDATLTGTLAWDDAQSGRRPGVLVVHEWWGLNEYAKGRAKQLAAAGYVAFAVDMYGDNKVTSHPKQAGKWMKQITGNVGLWTRRAQLGLDALKAQPEVDGNKTAAIGYCFGGSTVMQMAYAGAKVNAVVSFHGSLPPAPESVTSIKPRVLVAHGRDDTFIPKESVAAFQEGLDRTGADWEMAIYSDTRHAFTNPAAGKAGIANLAYNATADRRSWQSMMAMLRDVF